MIPFVVAETAVFVPLLGSERLRETKSSAPEQLKETGSINKSLFTLGKVISTLCDIAQGKYPPSYHIPYRDSTLTKLLMDSLGGTYAFIGTVLFYILHI